MSATCLLLFTLASLLIIYLYEFSKSRPKNFPPGPPRLPIWGSYWFLLKENYFHPHLALEKLRRIYKTDILGLYLGHGPTVVTFSSKLCKEMLTREEFVGRPDTVILKARALGEPRGIFFIDGPLWKEQRWFSLRHLRDFGFGRRSEILENLIEDEVRYLIGIIGSKEVERCERDISRGNGEILIPDAIYGPIFNTILSILASSRFENRELRELGRCGMNFFRNIDGTGLAIGMTPWLRYIAPGFFRYTKPVESSEVLLDFVKEILDEHVRTFSDDHYRDFIDAYIGEARRVSPEGLNDFHYYQLLLTVVDYMIAPPVGIGHNLEFYFAFMINNPGVQRKVQEEIDRVVGRSRLPNLDDRIMMPYTEASLRELVRIMPVNPLNLPRRCMKDTTLAGYFIPKDTVLLPCVWSAHRDETIWDNTEHFCPERFLDESGNLIRRDETLVFGAGKRLCAGETFARHWLFLAVSGLLQNFTFVSTDGKPIDIKNNIIPGLVLSMKSTWIKGVPR